jgi:WD40 repeat protein
VFRLALEEGAENEKSRITRRLNFWMAHIGSVTSVSYIPDKNMVLTASTDCSVRLWTVDGKQTFSRRNKINLIGVYIGCFGQEKSWVASETATFSKLPPELVSYYEKHAPVKEVELKKNVGNLLNFWKSEIWSLDLEF